MEIIIGFEVISLVYIVLISIFYFSKAKVDNEENNIYKRVLIITIMNIVFEFLCIINGSNETTLGEKVQVGTFAIVVGRVYLFFLYLWVVQFLKYIFVISKANNTKLVDILKKKTVIFILKMLFYIGLILPFILPMYFYRDERFAYTWGPATDFIVMLFMITITFGLLAFFINLKKIKAKKYAPVFLFIFGLIIMIVVRTVNPSIQLVTTLLSITTILMYFTIENPDLKLVNELYKNKNIMEQTYEDKSNFLFEMTQEVREPILNIKNICNDAKDYKKLANYKESIDKISIYSKELDFIINDILDVSTLDSTKIRFVDNKYNLESIYNEIKLRVNSTIPKEVSFKSSISHNIPELYGDSIMLKQILLSLLNNSIKHTKSGFIEFNIDAIEKIDVARLIITIKDSSSGLPIEKINEILSITGNLEATDVEALNKSEINLQLCQKVIKQLGGNMLIKSDLGKGSEILLIVDQKINPSKEKGALDKYESFINTTKSVIVVNQNKKVNEYLKSKFNDLKYMSAFLLNGQDLIDRIKQGKKYDYIIVGDEMRGLNGLAILNKLKEIKDFNIPVIIMVDSNKENLRDHLLNEGFDNYILTSDFENDLEKIINNY